MVGDQESDLIAASRAGLKAGLLVKESAVDPFGPAVALLRQSRA
jgi:hypothetical protein